MWLVFALSGPVLWAVSTHIDKFLVDKYFRDSDTAVLMVFTAFIGVAALPVIWAFDPQVMALPATAIGVMTLSGILYMGAMLFYLRAIQREEASVVAPLFQANTLFTFALGLLILHEVPSLLQLGRAGLIVTGAIGLSLDHSFRLRGFKLRLVALMLAATLVLALSSVVFKFSRCMTNSGAPPSGLLSARACSGPPSWRCPATAASLCGCSGAIRARWSASTPPTN